MQHPAPAAPWQVTRATSLWVVLGWLFVAGIAACVTPDLPPAEPASEVTSEAVQRARQLYLYPERLDRRVLVGALDALEQRFDPVRFEDRGDHGILWVGSERAVVPLEAELHPDHFRNVLGQALAFVDAHLEPDALEEDEDLELLALRGGLAALDHYSTIFSGRGTEDFRIRFSGKLHGIGARIGRRDGNLTAVRVFPSSPAAKGGLEDGDAIIAIEGDPTRPLSVSEAVESWRTASATRASCR
jgi:carboxyl-terminal processing protease